MYMSSANENPDKIYSWSKTFYVFEQHMICSCALFKNVKCLAASSVGRHYSELTVQNAIMLQLCGGHLNTCRLHWNVACQMGFSNNLGPLFPSVLAVLMETLLSVKHCLWSNGYCVSSWRCVAFVDVLMSLTILAWESLFMNHFLLRLSSLTLVSLHSWIQAYIHEVCWLAH